MDINKCIFAATIITILTFPILGRTQDCIEPPTQIPKDIENRLKGSANILTKIIGSAEFEKQSIEKQNDAYHLYPNADKVLIQVHFIHVFCTTLKHSKDLTTQQKLEALNRFIGVLTSQSPQSDRVPSPSPPSGKSELVRLIPDVFEASTSYAGHPPAQSMDENLKSKWYTGGGVPPIGQYLKLSFREPKILMKIGVYNPEKEKLRLKDATLSFSDGSQQSAKFEGFKGWEYFELKMVKTKSIIIKAKEVYPPEVNYMVIYELELLGY